MANDVMYRAFPEERNQTYHDLNLNPENPLHYTDICKLSNTRGNSYFDFYIVGGREDCIDLNRNSMNNRFIRGVLRPRGNFGITCKGHSSGNLFEGIVFAAHGTEMDIDIANDSESTMRWTSDTILKDIISADGKPVTLRVGWGSKPKIIGGNVKYLFWQSLGLKAYVVMRWVGRQLKIVK
jgi:hypothetical protein